MFLAFFAWYKGLALGGTAEAARYRGRYCGASNQVVSLSLSGFDKLDPSVLRSPLAQNQAMKSSGCIRMNCWPPSH